METGASVKRILRVATVVGIGAAALLSSAVQAESSAGETKALAVTPGISAEQKSEAVQRMGLAKSIITRLESEVNQMGLAPEWKQATMNILLSNSSSKLAQIARIGGYQATIAAATSGKGLIEPKAIGSTTEDLIFHPWTPCRYVDTRIVGGKIAGTRGYDLTFNGAAYGGVAGCAPPTLAGVAENSFGAMAMNITIVDTSTAGVPGFAAARPVGSTALTSLVNWYVAGPTVSDANAAIVQMDQGVSFDEFEILTSGPVHVVIDLFGAFTSPNATALDCVTRLDTSQSIPTGISGLLLSNQACAAGYSMTGGGCGWLGGSLAVHLLKIELSAGTAVSCQYNNLSGSIQSANMETRCCRIPGH